MRIPSVSSLTLFRWQQLQVPSYCLCTQPDTECYCHRSLLNSRNHCAKMLYYTTPKITLYVFTPSSTALSRSSNILSVLPLRSTVDTEFPPSSFLTTVTFYKKQVRIERREKEKQKHKRNSFFIPQRHQFLPLKQNQHIQDLLGQAAQVLTVGNMMGVKILHMILVHLKH